MTLLADRPPLERFLHSAVAAAGALAELHETTVVHGALTPEWLGGGPRPQPSEAWAYKSPEQTGRLQRPVDARSDLYALGVMLYELLTGRLPFEAADPLEWAHRHLAMPPRRPRAVDPEIPVVVERIVLRLLEKDPEDRYQTADGLRHDLERCLEQRELGQSIAPFPLGERDRAAGLSISQKVYGRQQEQRALLDAFADVLDDDGPRVLLVVGAPGVGKSVLVRALAGPVAAAGGLLVSGEFEDTPRGVPYAPIVGGFGDLVALILAGHEETLAAWRERLQAAVGSNGRLLTDVVPQLELVLGPQPAVASLPPVEAHYRFVGTFGRFAAAFATPQHPLVMLLDDLQWADTASLRLLTAVASERSLRSLLVVGAYRDDAPSDGSLSRMLDELRDAGASIETVTLGPLGAEPLTELLADALGMDQAECEPLQAMLYEKTAGNPLFFTQLLLDLRRAGLVRFDRDALVWCWDSEGIRQAPVSANVVALLTEHLAGCPPETQRALSIAACLGGSFDAELLSRAGAGSGEEAARLTEVAVRAGFLIRNHDGFRFSHDRVREAAYGAIPVEDRPSMHVRIGRAMLAHGADLFAAVGQLDRGRSAVVQPSERRELARLNLLAAQRARAAAAFDAVSEYCGAGLELLGTDAWASEHELGFALTRELAEAELYAGNLEEAERLLSAAVAGARTRLERTLCARVGIDLKATVGANVEGLELAMDALRMYGLDVSLHPGNIEDVERAMRQRLGDRPVEALMALPLGDDPEIGAALDLLARAGPHGYIVDPHLHRLLACLVIDLTLQHGVFAASAWGLAAYGFELSAAGRHAEGDRFATVALGLVDRHGFVSYRAFVCTLLSQLIWTREFGAAAEIAHEGVSSGIENGDVLGAAFCWLARCLDRFAAGTALAEVERDVEDALEFAQRVRFVAQADTIILLRQLVRALCGRTDRLTALTGPDLDEVALEQSLKRSAVTHIRTKFYAHSLQAQVFGGDFAGALATTERLTPELPSEWGLPVQADAAFFGALAIAGCDAEERRARLGQLRAHAERLDGWAKACAANFAHQAALVAGELARAEDRPTEALELFALAIVRAQTHASVHVEALAHESAARLYREQGRDRPATGHIRDAIGCYRQWGATAKVAQLAQAFPSLAAATGEDRGESLDALAVAKASQAISGEVVHERVLERLLETVITQAGARTGKLLLRRRGQTVVVATAERTHTGVAVTVHDPPLQPSPEVVAETVVNYVNRTKRPLIIGDATARSTFAADPYIVRRHVRSMLSVPILAQGELRGQLCLENDLIADAFTTERLAALDILTAQAVISLENASLYAELRREIADRKRYEGELQHLADHDSLSGLFNRRRFREELDRELARAHRSGVPGAVLSIDLDYFKYVNDSLGHSVGDELIAAAGGLFARRVRGTDVLARIGGDEFAVLLPDVSEHEAELVANALLEAVRSELKVDFRGQSRPVTASIGIAAFSSASDLSAEELLVEADIAMYDAKEAGRNRVSIYSLTDDHQEGMQARLTWGERIRRSLDENRLVLHAQPILPLNRDSFPRHELLVRMIDDDGGLIAPDVFLHIAERMDLIDRIDRWVVREAIRLLAIEQRAGHELRLHVNLSAVSLADEELPDYVARELENAAADGRGLCFEITETTAIINMERARRFAARVAELGCQFALDDFGTGFASFYYVKHLPFDYLKIDGEFIEDLASNGTDQLVVKSIAEIAHGLGKYTIAEFVSDGQTLELLKRYGVDYAQGFHISKPTPITEVDLASQPVVRA